MLYSFLKTVEPKSSIIPRLQKSSDLESQNIFAEKKQDEPQKSPFYNWIDFLAQQQGVHVSLEGETTMLNWWPNSFKIYTFLAVNPTRWQLDVNEVLNKNWLMSADFAKFTQCTFSEHVRKNG